MLLLVVAHSKERFHKMFNQDATFINCTPHVIRVANESNEVIREYPTSEHKAVAKTFPNIVAYIDEVPMSLTAWGPVSGLPEPQDGVYYLVSTIIFAHPDTAHRTDLAVPDSGPDAIRKDGQPYAVRRFSFRQ
jgi:hypothetical protein